MLRRPFTPEQLKQCHFRLQKWRSAQSFLKHTDFLHGSVEHWFEQNWLREAWEASQFIRFSRASSGRLSAHNENENSGFDFEIGFRTGRTLRVQSTLVDYAPGTIVDRVRELTSRRIPDNRTHFTPRAFTSDDILRRVSEEATKKAAKKPRYPSTALLLHVNMSPYSDLERRKTTCGMGAAIAPAAAIYKAIWVFDKISLRRYHPFPWHTGQHGLAPRVVREKSRELHTKRFLKASLSALRDTERRQRGFTSSAGW